MKVLVVMDNMDESFMLEDVETVNYADFVTFYSDRGMPLASVNKNRFQAWRIVVE